MVKVADFSALDHTIISPMWVRASLGARVTCGTSHVLLAGVSGGFSPGTPVKKKIFTYSVDGYSWVFSQRWGDVYKVTAMSKLFFYIITILCLRNKI